MSRSRSNENGEPKEICIVMLSAIGDAVHVLPVANALKRRWPGSRITWLIQPVPHLLVDGHSAIDEFVIFHRRRGLRGTKSFLDIAPTLRAKRFDLVLALQVYFKAGILTRLLAADRVLGFDRKRARDLNWLFTNERIPPHPGQHVQDQYFEFLEYLEVDPKPVVWNIPFTDAEQETQRKFFEEVDQPTCAVVVGTSKLEKNWDPRGYARVLEALESTHGLKPVLIGGPSSVEREIADAILSATKAKPIDTLGNDLRKLAYIVDGSALTLSPDTGPLHISRALETPVVGLYGYTNPKRTGPYGKYQDLVVDGYARFPDEDYPLNAEYRDGMKRITPEMVLEKMSLAVERYLQR